MPERTRFSLLGVIDLQQPEPVRTAKGLFRASETRKFQKRNSVRYGLSNPEGIVPVVDRKTQRQIARLKKTPFTRQSPSIEGENPG